MGELGSMFSLAGGLYSAINFSEETEGSAAGVGRAVVLASRHPDQYALTQRTAEWRTIATVAGGGRPVVLTIRGRSL